MSFDVAVSRRFGGLHVGADFNVGEGLTALVGASGAGKTSILNMIAGLLPPHSGRVSINGRVLCDISAGINIPPEQRRVGYVFQDARLFPHLRVEQNLLFGHRLVPATEQWIAPSDAIDLLGIGHLLSRWPRTLSGGEVQRVAIGRALLSGAQALLMDEPLNAVDQPRREEILVLIERLRDELHLPILYVTHDRTELARIAQTVIEVSARPAAGSE